MLDVDSARDGAGEMSDKSFFDDPTIGEMRSTDEAGLELERSPAPIDRPDPDGWDRALVSGPTFLEVPAGEADAGEWQVYYSGAGTRAVSFSLPTRSVGKTSAALWAVGRRWAGWESGDLPARA